MFDPSRDQVRRFFIDSWHKHRTGLPMSPIEAMAADIIGLHPEYHALLAAPDSIAREFSPADGGLNPFLHLSLHLAIEEQLTIDQPAGLRAAFAACQQRARDRHEALHWVLDCLGETVFEAQRNQCPPDGVAYIECVLRKAGCNADSAAGPDC